MSTFNQPELFIGMQESFSKVITEGEAALYAGLVGDNSPRAMESIQDPSHEHQKLHVHHLFMAGIIGGLLNTRIPGEGSQCVTIQFEFLAPIFSGDRIETTIELVEFDPNKHLATFKTNCYNQSKNQVITGQAVMLVPA